MTGKLFIVFTVLTMFSIYSSYSGLGLEEIHQDTPQTKSSRLGSSRSYFGGGWSYGK